jgi:hypothetical protein
LEIWILEDFERNRLTWGLPWEILASTVGNEFFMPATLRLPWGRNERLELDVVSILYRFLLLTCMVSFQGCSLAEESALAV